MNPPSAKGRQAEDAQELRFLERLRSRCPRDVGVLKALGDLYTKAGRIDDGLEIDRFLVRLCPRDDMVWYNLGCSYALLGQEDRALHALGQAVDLGYRDANWMRKDQDLVSLREDPRFAALIKRAKEGQGAS
jgi:Flp pilus assembly protein TadD